jgi:hypothetical protein
MSGHHSTGKCGGISGGCACHCDDCFSHYAYDLMIRDRELVSARAELAAEREKTRIAVAKFETIRDQYPKTDVAHSFTKEALAAIAAVRVKP